MLSRKFDVMHIERLLIMSDLYNRIEELCSKRNINITTMCRESGASRASITDLKMGRKQGLSAETLSKISNYFGVSVDHLLGNESKEKPTGNKADELDKEFSDLIAQLSPEQRELVKAQIKGILSNY